MWSGKLLSRSGPNGYDIILRGAVNTLVQNAEENTKEDYIIKRLNKNTYNGLVWVQYDTVCFKIV